MNNDEEDFYRLQKKPLLRDWLDNKWDKLYPKEKKKVATKPSVCHNCGAPTKRRKARDGTTICYCERCMNYIG